MKPFLSLAVLLAAASLASAQASQTPVFYPPTDHLVKSEITPQGKQEVIERRTLILLGFAPRTQSGETEVQTRPLSNESQDLRLEAHIKSRDFDGVFTDLKTEILKGDISNFQPRIWKWSIPARVSGWGLLPSNTLTATPRYGSLMYGIYTQRIQIEGTRDSKDPFFNFSGKGNALHFKANISTYVEGPMLRPLQKGSSFDFQTFPTREQLEAVDAKRYGG